MSEQAPEAPGRAGPKSGKSSAGLPAFLTRKVGGFPVWVYGAVLAGLLLWRYQSSKSAAATSTSSTGTTTTGTSLTDASQVPQFVNQTYTSTLPPHGHGSASTPATTPTTTPAGTSPASAQPPVTVAPGVQPPTSGPLPTATLTPTQAASNYISRTQTTATPNPLYNYDQAGPILIGYGAGTPSIPTTLTPAEQKAFNANLAAAYRAQGQTPPAYLTS